MNKVYKYVLTIFIIAAAGYLTYDHYTDPIYQVKVGTEINLDDYSIENTGGRFSNDDNIFIGFKTRVEEGTVISVNILNETDESAQLTRTLTVPGDEDFHWIAKPSDFYTPGNYTITFTINNEVVETSTFIIEN